LKELNNFAKILQIKLTMFKCLSKLAGNVKKASIILLMLVFSIGIVAPGCETNTECTTMIDDVFAIEFRRAASSPSVDLTKFDSIYSLTDRLLFYTQDTIVASSIYRFPVNTTLDSMQLFFVKGQRKDTLTLGYRRGFTFVSPECGMLLQVSALAPKFHTFDSVFVNSEILLKNETELIIFY
jgi:hypothetical protein